MKTLSLKWLGLVLFSFLAVTLSTVKENQYQKAAKYTLNRPALLQMSKVSYQIQFQNLSNLDETKVDQLLGQIHQIEKRISKSVISHNGEIMMTLAQTIDDNLVLVIFKNQQIQMIQKVKSLDENLIEFQYGKVVFQDDKVQLALSQNIELEF